MEAQTVTGLTSITSGVTSIRSGGTLPVQVSSCSVAVRAKGAFLLDFTRSLEGSRECGQACSDAGDNRDAAGRRYT
jgi:hypothetical protein